MKYLVILTTFLGILFFANFVLATDFNNTGFEFGYGGTTGSTYQYNWCPFYDSYPNDTSIRNNTIAYAGTWSNYGGGIVQLLHNTSCKGGVSTRVAITMKVYVNSTDELNTTTIYAGSGTGVTGSCIGAGYGVISGKTTYITYSGLTYDTWQDVYLAFDIPNCWTSADPELNKSLLVWIDTPQGLKLRIDEIHAQVLLNESYGSSDNWGVEPDLTKPETGIGNAFGNITGAGGFGILVGILFTPFIWATGLMVIVAVYLSSKVKNDSGKIFLGVCVVFMIAYAVVGIYPFWILIIFALLVGLYVFNMFNKGG